MIELQNVYFSYKSPRKGQQPIWSLQDVSLQLDRGQVLGIAGRTGSGKSTLARHMGGLLQASRGKVLVDGIDFADKAAAARLRGAVGLLFQHPQRQLFAASVEEDVCFGPLNLGLSEQEARKRCSSALALVGLDAAQMGKRNPFQLSGGQQQRVAIAGVLAMQPRYLVLDEPLSGLDARAKREMKQLLKNLSAQGLGIALVSHDMDDLAELCSTVLVLQEGRVAALETPAQLFCEGGRLSAWGLEAPGAQNFAEELQRAGFTLPAHTGIYDLESLSGAIAEALQG